MLSRRTARWYAAGLGVDDDPIVLADGTTDTPFLAGITGTGGSGWTVTTSSTPGVGSLRFRQASRKPNIASVPIFFAEASYAAMSRRRAALIAALNPERGSGRLRLSSDLSTDDGADRWAEAVYLSGAEGDESLGASGAFWYRTSLKFQLLDSWTSPNPMYASWSGLQSQAFFPFTFPWSPSLSGVAEQVVLDVRGDADSWPTFDLHGPFTKVRVRPNDDTRQTYWEINRSTGPAEMLRLVTKPGEESLRVFDNPYGIPIPRADSNAWGSLHPHSWFEALRFRDQLIIDVDGSTPQTLIELTAYDAWQTAP